MKDFHFRAMGCQMSAFLDIDSQTAAELLQMLPDWFETWEQILSRFRPTSELNRLNESAGTWFSASPFLLDVIQAALVAAKTSQGLVVPTVRKSLERVGYDRSFDKVISEPVPELAIPLQESFESINSWQQISIDHAAQSIYLPSHSTLDLGGVAKGWAAQQAVWFLSQLGPALVNAGGDIAISAPRMDGSPWTVAIEDPLLSHENLGVLSLNACGVATSGIDYRRWTQNGQPRHHIIDPRTGEPTQTDLMSVTVIAPDVLIAEAAAKTILILGSQPGLEWVEDQPSLCAVLALKDGQVIYSRQLIYTWS